MLRRVTSLVTSFIAVLAMTYPQIACADGLVNVQFVERPPYMHQSEDGSATGVLATTVNQVFKTAGVPMIWTRTSVKREWAALQNPIEMTCAIAWFKTPEREKFAKFTKAIYRDQPFVLLARSQFSIPPNAKLETVMTTKGVRILLKGLYSYGPTIDGLLEKYQPVTVVSDSEYPQLPRMLVADRADFMFEAKEEADYLLANRDPSHGLHILTLANPPVGEKRYIACNSLVPDQIIDRLNRAIKFE